LARDLSGLTYPFLNVRSAHHPASHDDLSDDYERITSYYVGQLASLATRLAAMKEGDSTVLDNSCLMFVSNMWAGSKHDSSKIPLVLVGGLGGTLQTGRALDYLSSVLATKPSNRICPVRSRRQSGCLLTPSLAGPRHQCR
jgi:hypothetical protein